jgi:PHD/YefM family antitoxin component YafN of YafNO toxin-antitoxin module
LAEYERMKEDLEMLRSKKLAKEIKKARKEAKKGKVISLEEVEKRLNL